jgi:hypothetical protein
MFSQDDVISVYTRQDAINDGVLVDVTETAKEMGFRYPVADYEQVMIEALFPTYTNAKEKEMP